MPSLCASGVSYAHSDAVPLFDDLCCDLGPGFVGLVGENGAGKTTLLRLLAGELLPSAGRIVTRPTPARVHLCPRPTLEPTPEVLALAASTDRELRRIAGRLELDPNSLGRWATLSPGERVRWQIGAALGAEPDVLLLDEPTNHLDAAGRALLLAALARFRGVGVVVSHDRALLDALTSRTLRLHRGSAQLWPGSYSAAHAQWTAQEAQALAARDASSAERRRLERDLSRARQERASADSQRSAGRRMKDRNDSDQRSLGAAFRAEGGERAAGRRVTLLRRKADRAASVAGALAPPVKQLGRAVFAGYERAPRPLLFSRGEGPLRAGPLTLLHAPALLVTRESRIHLAGPNGAGKSTLMRALLTAAALPADKVLHLPQELSEDDAVAALQTVRALPDEPRGRALSLLAALGVDPGRLLASARPSPGEARKLLLARGLALSAWVLVLDEPTNHLDLPSIERLQDALAAFPGAILLVTHDEQLAASCCNERWNLSKDGYRRSAIDHRPRAKAPPVAGSSR